MNEHFSSRKHEGCMLGCMTRLYNYIGPALIGLTLIVGTIQYTNDTISFVTRNQSVKPSPPAGDTADAAKNISSAWEFFARKSAQVLGCLRQPASNPVDCLSE